MIVEMPFFTQFRKYTKFLVKAFSCEKICINGVHVFTLKSRSTGHLYNYNNLKKINCSMSPSECFQGIST